MGAMSRHVKSCLLISFGLTAQAEIDRGDIIIINDSKKTVKLFAQ